MIAPVSPLPAITRAVLIDGWSQPGFAGTPLIQIDGGQAGSGDGLTITGSDVTVRGLDVSDFSNGAGIHISGTGATGNWIYGNFLGTDPTGTQALANNAGVEIDGAATQNLVGTNGDGVNDAAERNIISGDLFAGVWITGEGTSDDAVAGNFIGSDVTGSVALNNGTQPVTDLQGVVFGGGVVIAAGASGNRIGTDGKSIDDVGERNVIGGSGQDGIDICGTGTDGNVVAGNFVGSDVRGTASLGIFNDGVFLAEGASSNWIGVNPLGGAAIGDEGNVIPGNDVDGIQIVSGSDGNTIAGNKIGTDVSGTVALHNPTYGWWNYGVEVETTCVGNTIGGLASAAGNLISGNLGGIRVSGTANVVEGNLIGTDVTGDAALGNSGSGIQIDGGA
jgi:titin